VSKFFDKEVSSLVLDMERLQSSNGCDVSVLQRVRRAVSRDLLQRKTMDVTAAALGAIEDEATSRRLMDIINYCSEHFEVDDGTKNPRLLSAVVLPLSVRMHCASGQVFSLDRAHLRSLTQFSLDMQDIRGARKVVFDPRFYDYRRLFALHPRDLCRHLTHLAHQSREPAGGLMTCRLHAQADSPWRQVFLLGVEVNAAQRSGDSDGQDIHDQPMGWEDLGSAIIESADAVVLNPNLRVQCEAHGAHYLRRGIEFGMKGLRALRLMEMFTKLGTNGENLKVFIHISRGTVRTLAVVPGRGLELRAPFLSRELIGNFQQDLTDVAQSVLSEFGPLCVSIVKEESEYKAEARKHGAVLMRLVSKRSGGATGAFEP
jgi:hypothetical protein